MGDGCKGEKKRVFTLSVTETIQHAPQGRWTIALNPKSEYLKITLNPKSEYLKIALNFKSEYPKRFESLPQKGSIS